MSDLQDMPGHLIRRLQQAAVAIVHQRVGELGFDVTPVQFAAMVSIELHPGIDQATLAGMIAHDRTTITGVIDRLVQKNMVTRAVSSTDRRARQLTLTDEGERTLRKIAPAIEQAQKAILQGLTQREQTEFLRLLKKATHAVNALSRAPLKFPAAAK